MDRDTDVDMNTQEVYSLPFRRIKVHNRLVFFCFADRYISRASERLLDMEDSEHLLNE
jgi:hypothetical protein